jgi:myosin heavy subunit
VNNKNNIVLNTIPANSIHISMDRTSKVWWVPDDQEVWTLADKVSEKLPNGCVNFMVYKTKRVVPHILEKCLPADLSQQAPEDLVFLSNVNAANILICVRTRFLEKKIYTNMGMVLLSINPFEVIPGLYGPTMIKKYEASSEGSLPAHVYSIPSRAYHNLCNSGKDQSILISGESGAGELYVIL